MLVYGGGSDKVLLQSFQAVGGISGSILETGYLPERKPKSFDGKSRSTPAYERLVSVGDMLSEAIKRSRGRDNKSLASFAEQLRKLLEKWEA